MAEELDRAGLRARLARAGLEAHADRLAAAAVPGFLLEPADGARSRLGGPGLLPPGEAWPLYREQPLTFLAGLDLSEVPAPHPFPDTGWLVFFAYFQEEIYETPAGMPGGTARMWWTDAPVPTPAPPGTDPVVSQRAIGFRPALGPRPPSPDSYDHLGLDAVEVETYRDLVDDVLREAVTGDDWWDAHWIGGAPMDAQGWAPEKATTVLLHVGWDEAIGLCYADGGTITFTVADADLRVRDLSTVLAFSGSG